jgi:diacylglycerol diphosphate phosphatase / phosphatidate phosphatase
MLLTKFSVLAGAFYALDAVEPFHQHFALQNYTLQYPYAVHERVPVAALFIIAVVGPAVVIAIYTLVIDGFFSHNNKGNRFARYTLKERLWELNCGILGLLLASGTAFVITGALKNATGKPRPDFIARCMPVPGSVDPKPFGLSNDTICTQTDHAIMKDGYRSFPSGHSSCRFLFSFLETSDNKLTILSFLGWSILSKSISSWKTTST